MRKNRRGQVTAEIAVLFTFVIAALVFMGTYLQRGSQGSVKGNVDSIGQQFADDKPWKSISRSTQHQQDEQVDSGQCSHYVHDIDSEGGMGTVDCEAPVAEGFDETVTVF